MCIENIIARDGEILVMKGGLCLECLYQAREQCIENENDLKFSFKDFDLRKMCSIFQTVVEQLDPGQKHIVFTFPEFKLILFQHTKSLRNLYLH